MLRQDYITNEAVIVGIGYGERPNQRDRDLDPAKGSVNFLAFIEKELMPFIKSKYRVTDDRTLSGYSRGGEFATYVLFNKPGLFNTICIGAPSAELMPYARKYFADHKDLKARIFLGAGAYQHETVDDLTACKNFFLKQNCKDLEVESEIVPHAGHGAAKPQVIQDGIAFAFCRKHRAVTVPVRDLGRYTGTYNLIGQPGKQLKLYLKAGQLYFVGEGPPSALIPFTKDGFFLRENEMGDIFFTTSGGKMEISFTPYHQKPSPFAERLFPGRKVGK